MTLEGAVPREKVLMDKNGKTGLGSNVETGRSDNEQKLSHRSPHLGFQLATPGGGLIRRAALIFRGTTKLGATVPEPYT